MSSGEIRKVSRQDIQLVQNLIERCLQLYMSQKEVVSTLLQQAKIEPGFTELVWQKLEEENKDFFEAYNVRLVVKEQISKFNHLLERQVELMRQICTTGVGSITIANGSSHIPSMHQNTGCYGPEQSGPTLTPQNIHQSVGSSLLNAFSDGGSSIHPCMQPSVNMSVHDRRIDVPPNMLYSQNSNVGMMPGINGEIIKSEAGYAGNSPFLYGANGNVLETQPAIGDPTVSTFSSLESNARPLSEPMLVAGTSSFGFLGQIPRNFSLSDLTADFSHSSDILESYSRSPFLATNSNSFLNPHGRGEHRGDVRRLDTISEGLSYENFGNK